MTDKIDIPSFQIAASKMHANGNAYFKLFEKYVPRNLDKNSVVLLYKLDNLSCIYKIVNMNSKAHYVVVSNDAVNAALRAVLDKAIDVEYIKEFDFKETDMKFDCIVMNPPYCKNLHLKILAEAIKHLKDDGTCVNLSPVRWLQDPLAKYKKNCDLKRFEESIVQHINSVHLISNASAVEVFDIGIQTDLAIYVCQKDKTNFNVSSVPNTSRKDRTIITHIFEKIINSNLPRLDSKIETLSSKSTDNYVTICLIGGSSKRGIQYETHTILRSPIYGPFVGNKFNGKTIQEIKSSNKLSTCGNVDNWPVVTFNTGIECINFYNSANTKFIQFCVWAFSSDVNVALWAIPYMEDYTRPWDDARFKNFFGITNEEWQYIEKAMAVFV